MAKITFVTGSLLLFLAAASAAPAEKAPVQTREAVIRPVAAEDKDDLVAEKEDLKPAASHWGGLGYGGHYGGYWGGHYPYYSSYWGYPGYGYGGYGGYGYGWPYGGWGYGHGGYWY